MNKSPKPDLYFYRFLLYLLFPNISFLWQYQLISIKKKIKKIHVHVEIYSYPYLILLNLSLNLLISKNIILFLLFLLCCVNSLECHNLFISMLKRSTFYC